MTHARAARLLGILLTAALPLVSPAVAHAQGFFSPIFGWDFGGNSLCPAVDDCERKRLNISVGIGAMGPVVGFEEEIAWADGFYGDAPNISSSLLTVMSNFMLVPKLGPFRPYFLGGVGLIKSNVDVMQPSTIIAGDNNHFGWDVGGGLMILFGDHFGIRGDLRYYHSFQDLEIAGVQLDFEKIDFGRVAGGVVVKF